jgi:hypothetical protein
VKSYLQDPCLLSLLRTSIQRMFLAHVYEEQKHVSRVVLYPCLNCPAYRCLTAKSSEMFNDHGVRLVVHKVQYSFNGFTFFRRHSTVSRKTRNAMDKLVGPGVHHGKSRVVGILRYRSRQQSLEREMLLVLKVFMYYIRWEVVAAMKSDV